MANHKSAVKRIRRNVRRRLINVAWRTRVRTIVKSVENGIRSGDKEAAAAAFKASEPALARGAQMGVVHNNAMRRKLSRLSKRIRAM
ncbi:MAG: 30S ribosomal protein S20 [Alphaproteobacteria bacterium]